MKDADYEHVIKSTHFHVSHKIENAVSNEH